MVKGGGEKGSVLPKEHVSEGALGRVTRRRSMMQRVAPTVPILRHGHSKKSIAAKRVPLRRGNVPMPIPCSAENHAENAPVPTPHSAENLAENEVLNPPEKRTATTKEHTSSRAVEGGSVHDEAETSSCALATFRGFRVSHELVPVLQRIFEKYGDITKESVSHDPKFLSLLLGELCQTVETLKNMKICELSFDRLEKMCGNIKAMEVMNLNVGWLQKKLADIKEMKDLIMIYPGWKEEKSEIEKERTKLAAKRKEILVLEEKVRVMEDRHKESSLRIEKGKELFEAICTNNCAGGLL